MSVRPLSPISTLSERALRSARRGRFAEHAKDEVGVSRRAAYAAFGWVVVFVAWHVPWYFTGLAVPTSSHFHGTALMLYRALNVIISVMEAVGIALPLALARPWGRRVPRWMLLSAAWIATGLLAARGLSGILDDLLRAFGFPRGLTGMTTAQVWGTGHLTAWMSFAGPATDVLFVAGGLMFGLAALTYQRAFPRRRSAEHPRAEPDGSPECRTSQDVAPCPAACTSHRRWWYGRSSSWRS